MEKCSNAYILLSNNDIIFTTFNGNTIPYLIMENYLIYIKNQELKNIYIIEINNQFKKGKDD